MNLVDIWRGQCSGRFDLSDWDAAHLGLSADAVIVMHVRVTKESSEEARNGDHVGVKVVKPLSAMVATDELKKTILTELGAEPPEVFELAPPRFEATPAPPKPAPKPHPYSGMTPDQRNAVRRGEAIEAPAADAPTVERPGIGEVAGLGNIYEGPRDPVLAKFLEGGVA